MSTVKGDHGSGTPEGGTAEPGPAASTDVAQGERQATSAFLARLKDPIRFKSTHQARFEEIDPFGHMNNSHYLSYFLENRFIGLRGVNVDLRAQMRFPIEPHIRKAELEFIKPVLGDQEFTIESWLSEISDSACMVSCTMSNAGGTLLATCKFQIVCVDKKTRKLSKWPESYTRIYYHELAPE